MTNFKSSILQGLAVICGLSAAAFWASHGVAAQSEGTRMGLPQDWSHHHIVFSNPHDVQVLLKIRQDPRLLHQWLSHNVKQAGVANLLPGVESPEEARREDGDADERRQASSQKGIDWSVTLGATNSHLTRSQYPAKFSFDVTAAPDCANDFVVFPTALAGTAAQATVIAFDKLYSTQNGVTPAGLCGTSGPAVKWSYNTSGGAIRTSPVISLDGKKVAFVSRNTSTLHVLTIGTTGSNGASVTAPAVPGAGNNAVDKNFNLNGGRRDTGSSLFVDYVGDVGYVGDDGGVLHKINAIFNGVPTEVTTGGWPITVSAGAALNDPVFDLNTRNIFITNSAGQLSYVRDVGSTTGACTAGAPPCLGFPAIAVSSGSALVDAPIVDTSTGRVFSETSANGANAQITQTDSALGSVVRVNVGSADAANPMRNGDFDANYLNSVSTGFYYVCGKANNATLDPTLYRIGFDATGIMNSAPDAATLRLARSAAQCSPITLFFNSNPSPGKQWLFVGANTRCGASVVVGGGCIMSFDTTAGFPTAATAFVGERNGTSGIIIDNASTAAQASSIYFTNEGTGACGDGIATGGCAIKLTQSGLK